MQFPMHSGQILGMAGRIIVFVSGIAIAVLAGSGVYIWWRKRRARQLFVSGATSDQPT
jgi:uncharacterized iron-regulated membrane protein